ncbi:MAG: xanthine dehydrogenase small subunit [Pseudomonadota bacterium]
MISNNQNTRPHLRLRLNDKLVQVDDAQATTTLLDWLRLNKRMVGTKEGCAEGDCGACTVLVGRLKDGELHYEGVNACIRFLPSLDGCHVVTVEHLAAGGALHPVQQAMVEYHGSQCGFCTPGIVMSLYALWMRSADYSALDVERALQGNLCRCTGYAPIVRAALAVRDDPRMDVLQNERATITAELKEWSQDKADIVGGGAEPFIVPASSQSMAEHLADKPDATIVSGSTDVGLWVTKHMRAIAPAIFMHRLSELETVTVNDGQMRIGARVTYTDMLPHIDAHMPHLSELWWRIGGDQVRNMGTVGGNIANGSPIGDTPPGFIALGGEVVLRSAGGQRRVPFEDFFIEYGKQDRKPGEFVEAIHVNLPKAGSLNACYKLSKRRDEDISAVCAAFHVQAENDEVSSARFAFGGMAGTPARASKAEAALIAGGWNERSVRAAMAAMADDFTPFTDVRATSAYRMKVAQNLLYRFWLEHGAENAELVRLPSSALLEAAQ